MDKSLGKTLKQFREMMGLTLREVQKETGISNAYISQIENGSVNMPTPNKLFKLSETLNIPFDDLMRLAGHVVPKVNEKGETVKKLTNVQTFLSSTDLTDKEEEQLVDFIKYLRSRRNKSK